METLSKYEGYRLFDLKTCRPQANMEVATIKAEKFDVLKGEWDQRVILCISNNNSQFECMIPKKAFDLIADKNQVLLEEEIATIDGMIANEKLHAKRCENLKNRVMTEKQKSWGLKKVSLLEKIKFLHSDAQSRIIALENHIKKTCANALELGYCNKSDCENCDTRKVLNDK